jgi:hypothetical protein
MGVSLRTFADNFGGTSHYHVIGNGKTNRAVSGIFNLNDTYHVWLDGTTLLPSRMTSELNEDTYRFRANYNYDWDAMTVGIVSRDGRWDGDFYSTVPLQENSGDAVSLFFRMRAVDTRALVPGVQYPLDLLFPQGSQPIAFTFIGREELKIKKIGAFRALRFTCTMATSDGTTFEEGMTLTVWISDDANKIPLLVECPVRIGSVRVTLAEGAKVAHPLTSLIE